jgi:hypothetical protein
VRLGLVGDVLAAALEAAAAKHDHGADAREPRGDLELVALQRVVVDLDAEAGDGVVERHAPAS